jgi:hypothetical protein
MKRHSVETYTNPNPMKSKNESLHHAGGRKLQKVVWLFKLSTR